MTTTKVRGVDKWMVGKIGVGYSFIIQECLSSADLRAKEPTVYMYTYIYIYIQTEREDASLTKIMIRIITMIKYTNVYLREMKNKK